MKKVAFYAKVCYNYFVYFYAEVFGVIKLSGNWDEGYALDEYTIRSVPTGYDAFGNMSFDTEYTEVGQLIHDMKYNGHFNTSMEIAKYAYRDISVWLSDKSIDTILPVPPTRERTEQPVFLIAESIAQLLKIPYTSNVLMKTS